jgi:hypothetical protein
MLEFLQIEPLSASPYNPNLVYRMEVGYDNGGGFDDDWEEEADEDIGHLLYLQKDDEGGESLEISHYKQKVPNISIFIACCPTYVKYL